MDPVEKRLAEIYQRLQLMPNLRNAIEGAFSEGEHSRYTDLRSRRGRDVLDLMLTDYAIRENIGRYEALIELAYLAAMLRPGERERLLTSLRTENPLATTVDTVPVFREDGALVFGNEVIGKFQLRKIATRFTTILSAFQKAHWRPRIKSPLRNADWQQTHDAIAKLNRQVRAIQFHVLENGRFLTWDLRKPTQDKTASQ